jgi:hypothetical protein
LFVRSFVRSLVPTNITAAGAPLNSVPFILCLGTKKYGSLDRSRSRALSALRQHEFIP